MNDLNLQPSVLRVIIPLLQREINYQKPWAIMKCRMVLLYHYRLRIPLNIPTQHY